MEANIQYSQIITGSSISIPISQLKLLFILFILAVDVLIIKAFLKVHIKFLPYPLLC